MITIRQRKRLDPYSLPENAIGWDCEGQIIMPGDKVLVAVEEEQRKGHSEYFFCSAGAQGTAVRRSGPISCLNWDIIVEFLVGSQRKMVGCVDIHLRKL